MVLKFSGEHQGLSSLDISIFHSVPKKIMLILSWAPACKGRIRFSEIQRKGLPLKYLSPCFFVEEAHGNIP